MGLLIINKKMEYKLLIKGNNNIFGDIIEEYFKDNKIKDNFIIGNNSNYEIIETDINKIKKMM